MATNDYNPVTALAKADPSILPGADVLEALVYLADPQAECRQTAEQALQVFGSVGAVLSARVAELTSKLVHRHNHKSPIWSEDMIACRDAQGNRGRGCRR